jgi:uncharacterized DUF497 family protein
MRFTWNERKRKSNLRDHGLDFIDAEAVFAGLTFSYEDDRFEYGEFRLVTLGLLRGVPVSVVHTETDVEIRVISFRRATDNETEIFFGKVQDQLPGSDFQAQPRRKGKRRASRGKSKPHRRRNRPTRPKGRSS